ncbi:pH regulation protein F [Paracoccus caeni]|uniref:PH regulation protein F n=1 Tax=Paracoccus caeni TaxID=657651 RepID=A0A934VYV8_9RHOB|nr:monovalent cation/H+ antiporter complex subunit F [Paracoccus caeni]MBK4216407.1 pH regulation protein F [Paracoccus caeni]
MTCYLVASLNIALAMVALAIAIGFIRLWRGPTLADRVVALDMMTAAVIAFCGLFAVRMQTEAYLDIAVVLALASFVSVVALARYAERQARKSDTDD